MRCRNITIELCRSALNIPIGLAIRIFAIRLGSPACLRSVLDRTAGSERRATGPSMIGVLPQWPHRRSGCFVYCVGTDVMGSDRFASAWRLATTRTYPMCLPESSESESISNWLSGGTEPQVGRPNLDAKFTVEKDRRQSPPAIEVQHTHPIRSVVMSICQSIFIYRNMVSRSEESQWTERQSSRDLEWCGPVPGSSRRSKVAITLRRDEHMSIDIHLPKHGFTNRRVAMD